MTTVGFGDYVPLTSAGKWVTILTALWGGFIITLLIVSVNGIFSLSRPEKVAFQRLIQLRSAVSCIISALKYQVLKKKNSSGQLQRSSLSFLFDPVKNSEKVIQARERMEHDLKKFSEVSRKAKNISK